MEHRRLGRSGLLVSAVGLGTNNFGARVDEAGTKRVVDAALDLGVTFIDTADVYGRGNSEERIGKALKGKRERAVIATKFGFPMGDSPYERGGSRKYIALAVEASLRRLGTDHVDLYQMHTPDAETPLDETLRALDDLVRSGKVRYIGTSNYAAWQIVDAQWTARSEHLARPISAQHPFSILDRSIEQEVLPACRAMGLGLIPYSPLAGGFLTGKYREGVRPEGARLTQGSRSATELLTPENFSRLAKLEAFAAERGHTLLDLAFAWLLSHPEIPSVIAGATKPEQVAQNARAGEWRLTAGELAAVAAL